MMNPSRSSSGIPKMLGSTRAATSAIHLLSGIDLALWNIAGKAQGKELVPDLLDVEGVPPHDELLQVAIR